MVGRPIMPNFVPAIAQAGVDVLRSIAGEFADWQLREPIDTTLDDAEALAAEYLAKLEYPQHVFDALPPDAQDRVALAVGVVAQADWQPAEPVDPDVPDYARPSWEQDVYAVLFVEEPPPPPALREPGPPRPDVAASWPELTSLDSWRSSADVDGVARQLAAALGADWEPVAPGPDGFARLRYDPCDVVFVAVPGGRMRMGMSDDEVAAMRSVTDYPDEMYDELVAFARPVHDVDVDPFLCAVTPLLERHGDLLGIRGDAGNPHGVLRTDAEVAAQAVAAQGFRLPTEAEWEWIARAGGARIWVCGDEAPGDWAQRQVSEDLESLDDEFGVLGLGWDEWTDDGWHPSYEGAPERSVAWEPKVVPETSRGGALGFWPWQSGGEAVLCLAGFREQAGTFTGHAVRFVLDLPPRSSS